MSQRPAISIAIKPVGGGKEDRIYTLAGWERDGKVSSLQLDKRVKAMKLQLEDGSVVVIQRGADGKCSHYFDLFDNRERESSPRPREQTRREVARDDDFGGGDFGDDPLPF